MNQTTRFDMKKYGAFLRESEKSAGTIEKYIRDTGSFLTWMGDSDLCKEKVVEWKESLVKSGYEPVTINSMLSSVNSFLRKH